MLSTPNRILSECTGKFAFETMAMAIASYSRNYKKGRSAYHCKTCKKYHVGHDDLRRGRKLQRDILNKKKGNL